MKKFIAASAALLATTTLATAGGLDRSGQGIGAIFEDGNYAELSYGSVMPSVSGSLGGGALPSGDMANDYSSVGFALKTQVNDKVSLAFIMDEPFGADIAYTTAGYPLNATSASVNTVEMTLLARYEINPAFSVHGGARIVRANGFYDPTGPYASTYAAGSDTGYVIGAAFEKPEIAMRVALTYSSAVSFALDGTVGDLNADMPQSVNLDFQSGIAANTLLFGQIRWADWSAATIDDTLAGNLASYDNDTLTYSIGVGRKFSDSFSGAVTFGYEKAQGTLASNLSPTDGYLSVGLGGTYTVDNIEISGGIRYVKLGDATTEHPVLAGVPFAQFGDNSALGVGLKIAYNF